ncbi:Ig-like domain-containing protein [bacterium]|nr:Ig-like domain-containing protein [bacterium]
MEDIFKKVILSIISLILIVVFLNSCGGDEKGSITGTSNSETETTGSESEPPSVSSIEPADNTENVAVDTSVSVTFSKTMKPSSITVNSTDTNCSGVLQISHDNFSSCLLLSDVVSITNDNKTFTINPAMNIGFNMRSNVLVTMGALDTEEMAMTAEFSSVFYTRSGVLDSSFGINGIVTYVNPDPSADSETGKAVVTDANGKIIVAGYISINGSNDIAVWRYNPDGSLDTGFGTNGVYLYDGGFGHDEGYAVAVDTSNRILVAGTTSNGANFDMILLRITPSGTPDFSFDGDGDVTADIAGFSDNGYGIGFDSNEDIMVAGQAYDGTDWDLVIWKFNINGGVVVAFGASGKVITDIGGNSNDNAYGMTVDSNGKMIVVGQTNAGSANYNMLLVRYNVDGTLDTSFNTTGIVTLDNIAGGTGDDTAYSVTVDPTNDILVTGQSASATVYDMFLLKYKSDGTLDNSFGTGGIVTHNGAAGGSDWDYGNSIALDSANKVVVVGTSKNIDLKFNNVIWRYNPDGTLDTGFNSVGIAVHGSSSDDYFGSGLSIDANRRMLVTGTKGTSMEILRYY